MEGLKIVFPVTFYWKVFKVEDSKRFLLIRLIEKYYQLLDRSPPSQSAKDSEDSHANNNEGDRLRFMVLIEGARAFLRLGRQPEENVSRARTVLSPRFLYY